MKDLCIEFKIDDVKFVVTSISNKLITSTYPKHCHSKTVMKSTIFRPVTAASL